MRAISKWSVAGLIFLSLMLVGCSGSGAGNGNNNVGNGGLSPANLIPPPGGGGGGGAPTFSVPNFGAADLATLMASYQPPTETGTNASFTATSANRGTTARTEVDFRDGHSPGDARLFDDGYYTIPRSLEPIEPIYNGVGPDDLEAARTAVPSRGTVAPRFQAMAEGAVENFTIIANGSIVVPCQKMHADAETQFCTIFAEQVGGNPIVNKARALQIRDFWDTASPTGGGGIYPQMGALFGSEWNQNPVGGRDGDLKICIVLLSSNSIGGAGLFGYFAPGDEFVQAGSNQGEILYINADKPDFDLAATLAHEFQHMQSFNQKVIQQGTFPGAAQNENATINEGQSTLAEHLLGFTIGAGNQFIFDVVQAYLQSPQSYSFFAFNFFGTGYGEGFLLEAFIAGQYGTATITTLATSTQVSMANVNNVLPISFAELFRRWTVANYADGLGGTISNNFSYQGFFAVRANTPFGVLAGAVPIPIGIGGTVTSPLLASWAVAYLQYSNGTGTQLDVTVTVPSNTDPAALVHQGAAGTVNSIQDSGFLP